MAASPALRNLSLLILLGFAFFFNWAAGHRGLFIYDTSIVFDGMWRVLQGQSFYTDILVSHAPLIYYLGAGWMAVFGVTFSSFIGFASFLNMTAVLMAYRICRILCPGLEWLAGLVTAVWFIPMTGFIQVEQGAFWFDWIALWLFWEAWSREQRSRLFLSGVAVATAFFVKQNGGGLFVLVLSWMIVSESKWPIRGKAMRLAMFGAGGVAATAVFVALLAQFSEWSAFWHHAVEIPSQFGLKRISGGGGSWQRSLTPLGLGLSWKANLVQGIFYASAIFGAFVPAVNVKRFAYLMLALTWFQGVFASSALNDIANAFPFIGLQLAYLVFLTRPAQGAAIGSGLPVWHMRAARAGAILVVAVLLGHGLRVSWLRGVNGFSYGTSFSGEVNLPGMKGLTWGDPTYLDDARQARVTKENFESLTRHLEQGRGNFVVLATTTILYGMLQRPSTTPWLFFLEGHSFSEEDMPALDRRTLAMFQKYDLEYWVEESHAFLVSKESLNKLQATMTFLRREFRPEAEFGPFRVHRRIR